jgi:signal transduction histidine kinase
MLMNKLGIPVVVFVACFLSASTATWAADKPTEADVQQITLKAAALIKDKGVDVGRKAFDADGEFKFGEIYVNVVSDKGLRLIYPPKPASENMDILQAQDVDGKFIVKELLEVAKTKGEGWVQYRWMNPATNKIAGKTTYVKAVPEREVIVYVGAYK